MASQEIRPYKKSRRSPLESIGVVTAPITGSSVDFPDSVLKKVLGRKLTLSKYLAILKRRATKGVTLQDLDALQLDLETLLIATVDRSKALIKECPVLEEKKSDSEHKPPSIKKKVTLPESLQKREIRVELSSRCVKLVKSGFREPLPVKPKRNKRKLDELPKSSARQLTVPESPRKESTVPVKPSNLGEENARFVKPSNLGEESAPCDVDENAGLVKSDHSREINACLAKSNNLAEENTDLVKASHLEAEKAREVVQNNLKENTTSAKRNDSLENLDSVKHDLIITKAKPILKPVAKPFLRTRSRNKVGSSKSFDSVKKYWHSISSIYRGIFEPDLKALDDLIKNQEAIEKNLKEIPEVGPLFASSWAECELSEEKNASCNDPVQRKTPGLVPKNVACFMKRAEKSIQIRRSLEDLDFNPLDSQLLSSFIDEGIISQSDKNGSSALIGTEVIPKDSDFESSVRTDLINIGVISEDSIVRADNEQRTEVDIEIKRVLEELRTLIKCNSSELNYVSKLAKREADKQEFTRKLLNKGREIERAYQSILADKKKGVSSGKKNIQKALFLVKEREIILCKLQFIERLIGKTRK